MSSLYTATELGTDLQTLGLLRNKAIDLRRLQKFRTSTGLEIPRVGRWLLRVAMERGMGRAEFPGWIIAGRHEPEPAGLPSLVSNLEKPAPDALPSALYGGLLRLGQSPNGAMWGAEIGKKSMPVYLYHFHPEHLRLGWRRRFDKLDDFIFYATKAALCQRDRITAEEFLELAQERGVRPEQLIPDALEDEREVIARLNLRKPKKNSLVANRFVWLDALLVPTAGRTASPDDIAKLWVNTFRLHTLREESDEANNPATHAFWVLRHSLFGDERAVEKAIARGHAWPLTERAAKEGRRWQSKKGAPFDRIAIVKAIEKRSK